MQFTKILLITSLFFFSCSGNSGYTLSVTVKGLQGSLIIQNNLKDNLTIDQDGNFSFKTTLADKEKFNVQVDTEPCAQRCEIKSGAGIIDGKNIDNVEINCLAKTWTESEQFLKGTPFESYAIQVRQIVMNRKGDIIVVWNNYQADYKSEFRDGVWHHPTLTEKIGAAGLSGEATKVAMNDNGDAILVWLQPNEMGNLSIYRSEYKFGVWNTPSLLSDSLNEINLTAQGIDVAMNNKGEIIIGWVNEIEQNGTGSAPGLFKSEYRNGKWSSAEESNKKINPGTGQPGGPIVVMNDKGQAMIVWSQKIDNPNDQRLFRSEFINDEWKYPLSTDDFISTKTKSQNGVKVKMNDQNEAVIFWSETAFESYFTDLRIAERHGGLWTTTSPGSIYSGNYVYVSDPTSALGLSQNGDAVISWIQGDGGNINAWTYKSERKNGQWNWPVSTSDFIFAGTNSSLPAVTMDKFGNIDIAWNEWSDNKNKEFLKQYSEDHWTDPKIIDTKDSPFVYPFPTPPTIASNECRKILLWTQDSLDGTGRSYIQQYY